MPLWVWDNNKPDVKMCSKPGCRDNCPCVMALIGMHACQKRSLTMPVQPGASEWAQSERFLSHGMHAEVNASITSSRCMVMGTTPSSLVPLPISRMVALAATGLMRAISEFNSASSVVSWASLSCEACEGKRTHTLGMYNYISIGRSTGNAHKRMPTLTALLAVCATIYPSAEQVQCLASPGGSTNRLTTGHMHSGPAYLLCTAIIEEQHLQGSSHGCKLSALLSSFLLSGGCHALCACQLGPELALHCLLSGLVISSLLQPPRLVQDAVLQLLCNMQCICVCLTNACLQTLDTMQLEHLELLCCYLHEQGLLSAL